jgi:DNA-binding response OmpR family regulator
LAVEVNAVSTIHTVGGKRVLLVGSRQLEHDIRAAVLRGRALTVDVAYDLGDALRLCDARAYSWILVDVRERLPGEVLDFCTHLREKHPEQHVAFLVGPPQYVTLDWPAGFVHTAAA